MYIKQRVQSLQDQIIKLIIPNKHKQKLNNRKEYYNYLNILPLAELYKYKMITTHFFEETYKIVKENNLRNNGTLDVPRISNKYGKRTLQFQIPTLFNQLPKEIKELNKIGKVKQQVKKHLMETIQ